jgi:hypothetical protein
LRVSHFCQFKECGILISNSSGSTAAQAIALVPHDPAGPYIEQKYRFTRSSSITFCPAFFDDSQIPNIYSVWTNSETTTDLNNVDCRERILIHEYLHLLWTRDMRPKDKMDYIGHLIAASGAAKLTWGDLKQTPDCYAWYALYSAYNNEHSGCGADIWPAGVKKPVAI